MHALNTLLQAPHFSEIELAQIAAELDAAERELMAGTPAGLYSADFLQYMAEGSGNVNDDGMFSIQVLGWLHGVLLHVCPERQVLQAASGCVGRGASSVPSRPVTAMPSLHARRC